MLQIIVLGLGVALIVWRMNRMSEALDRLTTEVSETNTVIDSALTLIANLAQQIRDAAGNPEALNGLADQLDAKANALAAAVDSMWTSSRMYTLVRPGEPSAALAMRSRMASTPLLEAASSS